MRTPFRNRSLICVSLLTILFLLAACVQPAPQPVQAPAAAPTQAPAPTKAPEPTKAPAPTQAPAAAAPTKAPEPTKAPAPTQAPAAAAKYKEAPALAEQVKAGKLPPVDQRLPKDVMVMKPEVQVGKYGGKVRVPHAWDFFFEQGLIQRLYTDRDTFVPQIAKEWKWAPDFTSITFSLREGMKWSDGKPYTTDDILFWWNDVVKSKHHAKPYTVAGMNVATDKVVKVDATTVRFEFAEPRPNFLIASRGAWSYGFYGYPAHYFKQYHPDYNGTAADKAQEVFQKLLDRLYQNSWVSKDVNAPTVNAWKVVDFKEGQYALFDRNPYFYGVDPENNQLPYIDQIEGMDKYDKDAETMKLKMLAGEADMLFRVVRPVDYPVFKEKEKQLGIQLVLLNDSFNGRQIFFFNQNSPTKNVVDLLRNADFRRAWSLALNRNLMNESIFLGLGKLGHGFSDAGVFDPKIDGAYATLDVAKANALLDALKLDKRDSEKFRLLPDGSPLTINLMFQSNWGIGADQVVQIAVDNLREIGLRVSAKPAERKVYQDTVNSDDWQVRLGPSTGGWFGYWGIGMIVSQFARQEWLWMTSAKEAKRQGVEPQGKLKEASDLYWNIQQSTDKAQQDKLRAQYRELMADQLWEVGSVAVVPGILIINASLKNVPGQVQRATIQQGESEYLRFEQWYLDK